MEMKRTFMSLVLAGALGVLQPVVAVAGNGAGAPAGNGRASSYSTSADALSAQETADILFMREEEKLARDVYTYLFGLWSQPVFENISASEQRHMDSMLALVETYRLTDPVVDDSTGAFTDPDLASMYISLTMRGQASLLEALRVGAFIEETDMRDIQLAIDQATHADIIRTYEQLLRGSRNHLRAFVRSIETLGVVYEAQVLPQEEVDAIVDSPLERGS